MKDNADSVNVLEPPPVTERYEPSSATSPQTIPASRPAAFLRWLARAIPTGLVLAVLGGLAYWGHHTGWTVPSFAALTGSETKEKNDWCGEHGVPESQCVECKTDLLPRGKDHGWCRKHGVSNCPFEHPEVAQLKQVPKITPADLERAQRALAFLPRPENNSKCKLHHRRIQFASQEAVEKVGIDVAPVWEAPVVEAISANGEITYDQTRVARLSARVPGTVWYVPKQVGDQVRRGDVLALVDAAEVGKAKAEFLQAITQFRLRSKTYESLRSLSTAVAEQRVREAESALSEAQIRLLGAQQALVNLGLPVDAEDVKELTEKQIAAHVRFLGLPDTLRQSLDPKTTTGNLLPVKAPLDGVIVAREVVAGEVVDSAKVLFVVADPRQMWLTLNLPQEDTKKLALGQLVRFRTGGTAEEVQGTVTWISTNADEKTRTVKVRANLANPEGRLRASTFGLGQIVLREEKSAIVVPNEAVHWEGDCFVVFVRDKNFLGKDAPKVFHVRQVRVGTKDAQNTEVVAGVLPGELVATRGSGTLRAELLKNNLGEG
ncbi:MAG TPA: efflux RND transporter periplasmic adaptor subunit [Gemmataceae bacterium]|nr:efflux RND transporter periplasmic adaptor subunit [Gemmataceae bacterium]